MAEHQHPLHFAALDDNLLAIHHTTQAIHHDLTKLFSLCAENTLLLRKILDLLPASTNLNQPHDEPTVFDEMLDRVHTVPTEIEPLRESSSVNGKVFAASSDDVFGMASFEISSLILEDKDDLEGTAVVDKVFDEMLKPTSDETWMFRDNDETELIDNEDKAIESQETLLNELRGGNLISVKNPFSINGRYRNQIGSKFFEMIGQHGVDSTERYNGVRSPYDQLVLVNVYYGGPIGEYFARVTFIYFDPGGRYVSHALLIGLESRLGHVRHVLHPVGKVFSIDSQDEVEVEVYELLLIQALVQSKFFDPGIFVVPAPLLSECQLQIFSDPSHVILWSFELNLGKPMAAVSYMAKKKQFTIGDYSYISRQFVILPKGDSVLLTVQVFGYFTVHLFLLPLAQSNEFNGLKHLQRLTVLAKFFRVQLISSPHSIEVIFADELALLLHHLEDVCTGSVRDLMSWYFSDFGDNAPWTITDKVIDLRIWQLIEYGCKAMRWLFPSKITDGAQFVKRQAMLKNCTREGVEQTQPTCCKEINADLLNKISNLGVLLLNSREGEVMDLLDKGSTVTYQLELLDSTRIHWMFLLLLFTNCVDHVEQQVTPLILADSEASYMLQPTSILVKLMLQHATFVMKQWLIPWDWCYSLAFNLEDKVVLKGE